MLNIFTTWLDIAVTIATCLLAIGCMIAAAGSVHLGRPSQEDNKRFRSIVHNQHSRSDGFVTPERYDELQNTVHARLTNAEKEQGWRYVDGYLIEPEEFSYLKEERTNG